MVQPFVDRDVVPFENPWTIMFPYDDVIMLYKQNRATPIIN